MNIYLIRHGETLLNQSNVHQYSTTPLSDFGLQQAEMLAKRLKNSHIDVIYSSPMMRAKQTAQAIAQYSGKEIAILENLREFKRPSEIEGKFHLDPSVLEIKNEIRKNVGEKNWHYSDEENFYDVKNRALEVLESLKDEKNEHILLVTHGFLIKMILAACIFGEGLTVDAFDSMNKRMEISNTGISQCQFSQKSGWKVITVNDTTHL
jgi:broad specificity phosphatase PhoE